ncbi:MAG: hypothetical protein ACRER2_02165 [Methylococcales bacterium]
MYKTVEAIVKDGQIIPIEPIPTEENSRFLLVCLPESAVESNPERFFSEAEY